METRTCKICKLVRSRDDFYAGQGSTCKDCTKARATQWRRDNPLRYRTTRKNWESGNIDLAITRRKNRLKRRYKLSQPQVERILEEQGYKCAICEVPLKSPFDKNPDPNASACVIDHDHRDGHVRGALCSSCNTGLGQFEDDPKLVRQAYYYLKADYEKRKANSALR